MGTRFMMTKESSAHQKYKDALVSADSNSTMLMMKKHIPVRLLKNKFYDEVFDLESKSASREELIEHLGHGRARAGMLEGDLVNGELETGQVCSLIDNIPTVSEMVSNLKVEYQSAYDLL